jgi:hypothetical protein
VAFVYDGDGRRVKKVDNGVTTTVYVGTLFEWNVTASVTSTYYFAGSKRIAVRTDTGLYHLHGDLRSTSFDPVFGLRTRCGRLRMLGSGRRAGGDVGVQLNAPTGWRDVLRTMRESATSLKGRSAWFLKAFVALPGNLWLLLGVNLVALDL